MIVRAWFAIFLFIACSSPQTPRRPEKTSSDREEPYVLWLEARETHTGAGKSWDAVLSFVPSAGTWWYEVRIREQPPTPASFEFSITSSSLVRLALIDDREVLEAERSRVRRGFRSDRSIALPASTNHPNRFLLRVDTADDTDFRIEVRMSWSAPPEPVEPVIEVDPYHPCDLARPDFKNPDCCRTHCGLGRRGCRGTILSGDKNSAEISLGTKDHVPRYFNGALWQPGPHGNTVRSRLVVVDVAEDKALVTFLSPDKVDPSQFANSHVILSPADQCGQSRP